MEQGAEPIMSLKAPALQATHSSPSPPVYPILHTQSVTREDPWLDEECGGQWLQDAADTAPTVEEYFPMSQNEHVPDPSLSLNVPSTHGRHEPFCGRPV
jgi:hypothetical protein